MDEKLTVCLTCKSLTTPKPSGLCVKCECFAEIDSGLPFRTRSERKCWPSVQANDDDYGSGTCGMDGKSRAPVSKTRAGGLAISQTLACGTGKPIPVEEVGQNLEYPLGPIVEQQSLLDQMEASPSSDSKTRE